MASMRSRFDPRYDVNWRLPAKIPIERPGKFTSTREPSVFTEQPVALNVASAFLISSGVRGSPYTRPSGPGGTLPLLAAGSACDAGPGCPRPRAGAFASPSSRIRLGHARNDERRIPERLPLVLFDDIGRDVDSQIAQGLALLGRHTPDATLDVELGREILPERRPLASALLTASSRTTG